MQAPLAKIRWTLNRLRSMELPEVAHRVKERARRSAARRRQDVSRFDVGDGPLPKIPGLTPFDACGDTELLSRWSRVAEVVRAGRFRFLGQEWPGVTDAGKWHLDPKTGKAWPSAPYCFDIPYRHERELGDIKYVWELNRLQFLQPIAALAGAEEHAELARYCAAELESWIDANAPFKGVNWASGIELALRIVSFCTVAALIGDEAFTPEQREKLRSTLAAHGYWLARYPSLYSSANNHLIAEAGGLFLLGALAPDLPNAAAHEAYGRRTLIAEAQKQIHDDGVGAEQSPSYTAFTLEWLLLCFAVARMLGEPLPQSVKDRLVHAADHLRWITDEGGNQPRIGDDDEGRVFYSQIESEDRYVTSILGGLAATLERPSIAAPAPTTPHLRNLVFGFARPSSTVLEGLRCFPTGGYTVIRETIAERRMLLVLDHGPLGYLSIAAHGHADALALALHVDDRPVLIDAGTYLYHSGGHWRDHFRGTKAHNTLNIDGEDQSIISGPFNWSHKANNHLLHCKDARGAWCIEAEHDGYQKRYGVNHRRQVARGDTGITCTDWLLGKTKRPEMAVEIRYLVAPGLEVLCPGGETAQIRHEGRPVCELGFSLSRQENDAALPLIVENGFASPRFGERVETVALVCRVPSPGMMEKGVTTSVRFI